MYTRNIDEHETRMKWKIKKKSRGVWGKFLFMELLEDAQNEEEDAKTSCASDLFHRE